MQNAKTSNKATETLKKQWLAIEKILLSTTAGELELVSRANRPKV